MLSEMAWIDVAGIKKSLNSSKMAANFLRKVKNSKKQQINFYDYFCLFSFFFGCLI